VKRLYFRIYVAVLASLLVFALAAGALWRTFAGNATPWQGTEVAAQLAQNVLPPASASRAEQQAALERIGAQARADAALFAADQTLLAAVGAEIPPPRQGVERGPTMWLRGARPWYVELPDGRWLGARLAHAERAGRGGPGLAFAGMLLLLLVVVGAAAHPVVRRITRRLERLQAGVESLERGDLSARVKVSGHDEIAHLATSFNRAAARIEALVNAHQMLLANASHELRTPLTRIRLGVELMKETADAKRKAELERDIAELDQLIDGILLASRLDALTEPEVREEVDLLALAAEECARYEGVRVAGEPAPVVGDPQLLRRMIRNLLDNATRHGRLPIAVAVHRVQGTVELRITDHGPGIPVAEHEKVFEPFRRAKGAGATRGSGLGLALVRRIARHHGGEARIAPGAGSGLTVVVII
jgi:signal transduction histidine kinase